MTDLRNLWKPHHRPQAATTLSYRSMALENLSEVQKEKDTLPLNPTNHNYLCSISKKEETNEEGKMKPYHGPTRHQRPEKASFQTIIR